MKNYFLLSVSREENNPRGYRAPLGATLWLGDKIKFPLQFKFRRLDFGC